MASFLGGLWDTLSGTGQIKAAAKSGKKAAKQQQATSQEQLGKANALYGEQKQTLGDIVPQQQAYLQNASNQQQNALTGDLGAQQALFNPYLQQGQQGMNALGGYFGNDPAQAAQMLQNFQNSPLYQSQYQNMLGTATQGLERNMGANRMLNSGRTLKGLQDRAGAITNQLFGQYVDQANRGVGVGQNAANNASNAYGQNAGLRSSAYGQLGANQSNALGSYGQNILSAGNQYGQNMGGAYGNVLNAQGAFGSAAAAGHMGQANTMQGLWSGAANLAGNALGAYTGGLGMAAGKSILGGANNADQPNFLGGLW